MFGGGSDSILSFFAPNETQLHSKNTNTDTNTTTNTYIDTDINTNTNTNTNTNNSKRSSPLTRLCNPHVHTTKCTAYSGTHCVNTADTFLPMYCTIHCNRKCNRECRECIEIQTDIQGKQQFKNLHFKGGQHLDVNKVGHMAAQYSLSNADIQLPIHTYFHTSTPNIMKQWGLQPTCVQSAHFNVQCPTAEQPRGHQITAKRGDSKLWTAHSKYSLQIYPNIWQGKWSSWPEMDLSNGSSDDKVRERFLNNTNGRIRSITDDEKQALHFLSFEKTKLIWSWIQNGVYEWDTEKVHMVQSTPTLPGCTLLAAFLPNIQSANVCAINIGGTYSQIILDSGASASCASLLWGQSFIAHNVNTLLQSYTGNPLFSCTGQPLNIRGTFQLSFELGSLKIQNQFIIYESHLSECLCGLDIIRKYSLIQTKDGVFIENASPNKIRQIEMKDIPCLYELYCTTEHHIECGGSRVVIAQIFPPWQGNGDNFLVASSEEMEPHKNIENLNVYFQKVKVNVAENTVELLYNNKDQDDIILHPGDLLGHMEKMDNMSPSQIVNRADEDLLGLYLTILDLNHREREGSFSSLYLDVIEQEKEEIEWNRLQCAQDPEIKEKLITMCQQFPDIWAINKQSMGKFQLGSDGPFHISVRSSIAPLAQPNIPPQRHIVQLGHEFLKSLLQRDLIRFASRDCPWQSSCFFLEKSEQVLDWEIYHEDKQSKISSEPEQHPEIQEKNGIKSLRQGVTSSGQNSPHFWPKSNIPPGDPKILENSKNQKNPKKLKNQKNQKIQKVPETPKNAQNGLNLAQNEENLLFPSDPEFWTDPKNVKNCKIRAIHRTRAPPQAGVRCVIDFKYVNMALKPQKICNWPILPCRNLIDRLQGKKYCSQLDLANAFWTFECDSEAEEIQTFSFDFLKFSPKRMCHGIQTAASAFQRQVYKLLLKNGLETHISNHIDNMILATDTIEQHYEILERLFHAIKKAGLKLHYYKQFLAHDGTVSIFGWQIHLKTSQVGPCPKKFVQIAQFQVPKNTRACRSYCGLWNFYSSIVPNLGQILSPLYEKCSGAKPFVWDTAAQKSWDESQKLVKRKFLLSLPDYNKRFFLLVDAARKQGYSCSVFQRAQNGQLLPINHSSKIFKGAQKNYSQFKSEFFALKQGLQQNIQYFGIAHPQGHIVFTDTQALQYAIRYAWDSSQLFRWSNFVFSLPVKIIPLSCNTDLVHWADMNSRPLQAQKQARQEVDNFNDKKYDPTNDKFLDFSGLGEIPIQQFFRVIQNFQKYVAKMDAEEIRKKWHIFKNEQILKAQNLPMIRQCVLPKMTGDEQGWPLQTYLGSHPISIYQDKNFCLKAELLDLNVSHKPSQQRCFENIGNIICTYLPPLSMALMKSHQEKDIRIKRLLQKIQPPYVLIEGLLFKKVNPTQFVLLWPKALNSLLLQTFHVFSNQVHLKKKKLKQLLDVNFDIQDFNSDFQRILDGCQYCLCNHASPQRKTKISGPSFLIKGAFQFFSFDYVTICSTWKKYGDVLSLVDNYSGATFYFACKATMSDHELVTFWFQNVFTHLGHFRAIHSDGQSQLVGRTFSTLCKVLNIRRFVSTHASQNLSEGRNKFLIQFLKSIHNINPIEQDDMPIVLSICTLLFNNLPVGPHFCAPARIMANFGPFSPKLARMTQIPQISKERYPEYLVRLQQLKVTCNVIQNKMSNAFEQGQNKKQFHSFQNFDFVLLKKPVRPGPLHKLKATYYKDCFFILRIFSKSALILNYTKYMGETKNLHRRAPNPKNGQKLLVHISKLKKLNRPLKYLNIPMNDNDFQKLIAELKKQAGHTVREVSLINYPELNQITKNQQKIRNYLDLPLHQKLGISDLKIRQAKFQRNSYELFCHLMTSTEQQREELCEKYKTSGIFRFTYGTKITEFSLQDSRSLNEDLLETEWNNTAEFRHFLQETKSQRKKIHFQKFLQNMEKSFSPGSQIQKFISSTKNIPKFKRKKITPFKPISSSRANWGAARTFSNSALLSQLSESIASSTVTEKISEYISATSASLPVSQESMASERTHSGGSYSEKDQIQIDQTDQVQVQNNQNNYSGDDDHVGSLDHMRGNTPGHHQHSDHNCADQDNTGDTSLRQNDKNEAGESLLPSQSRWSLRPSTRIHRSAGSMTMGGGSTLASVDSPQQAISTSNVKSLRKDKAKVSSRGSLQQGTEDSGVRNKLALPSDESIAEPSDKTKVPRQSVKITVKSRAVSSIKDLSRVRK